MTTEQLISHIRVIPDFPVKGINFQDVTTLFKDAECLQELSDRIYELYKDKGITKVVGIESRGVSFWVRFWLHVWGQASYRRASPENSPLRK